MKKNGYLNLIVIAGFYFVAFFIYSLFEHYARHGCSTDRSTYVVFLIVHVFFLYLLLKHFRKCSKILKLGVLPLAILYGMFIIAISLWSIAPILRYQ